MQPELIFFTLIILIFSIILHEVAHGYVAYMLGDRTALNQGRLTLNPIPHIDMFGSIILPGLMVLTSSPFLFGWAKPVPYNPANLKNKRWGEPLVAAAGSLTNLFIAVFFALILRGSMSGGVSETFIALLSTVVFINLFLGLFNLLPIPPFDGYTVLRGILPFKLSRVLMDFESKMMSYGPMGMIMVLFLFILFFSEPFAAFVFSLFGLLVGTY